MGLKKPSTVSRKPPKLANKKRREKKQGLLFALKEKGVALPNF